MEDLLLGNGKLFHGQPDSLRKNEERIAIIIIGIFSHINFVSLYFVIFLVFFFLFYSTITRYCYPDIWSDMEKFHLGDGTRTPCTT